VPASWLKVRAGKYLTFCCQEIATHTVAWAVMVTVPASTWVRLAGTLGRVLHSTHSRNSPACPGRLGPIGESREETKLKGLRPVVLGPSL
jgi:hypothetical protein